MQSTISSVLVSALIVTLAVTIVPGQASELNTEQAGAAADNPTPAPTAPDNKMQLEQLLAAMATAEKRRQQAAVPDSAPTKGLTEKFGVKDFKITRSAAGYMLDFRFHVVDAEKALPLFDHRIKPYLLTERTNIKLPVPMAAKVGAFRPTNRGKNIKADKTYYMLFGNPDSYVKPGQKVSVVIGNFRAEHLTVQ